MRKISFTGSTETGKRFLRYAADSNLKRIVLREEDHGYCCTLVCLPAHDYGELTPREREVMSLVQRGLSNKAIAAELGTSFSTATTHVRRIFKKLRISSRSELLVGASQDSRSGRGASSILL